MVTRVTRKPANVGTIFSVHLNGLIDPTLTFGLFELRGRYAATPWLG